MTMNLGEVMDSLGDHVPRYMFDLQFENGEQVMPNTLSFGICDGVMDLDWQLSNKNRAPVTGDTIQVVFYTEDQQPLLKVSYFVSSELGVNLSSDSRIAALTTVNFRYRVEHKKTEWPMADAK